MPPFLWGRSGPCSVGIFYHGWVLREHSEPTQSTLRACSVIGYVHPDLLTPLYSVQVVWFSVIFTISKYPHSTLMPVLNDASQNLMGFKSYWGANRLEQGYTSLGRNKRTGHPDLDEAISTSVLPFRMLCGPWEFRILPNISTPASATIAYSYTFNCRFIIRWLWAKYPFSVMKMLGRSGVSVAWQVATFREPM